MDQQTHRQLAITLDELKTKFNLWRTTRPNMGKIPEQLWRDVLLLLQHYPMTRICKSLGLSYNQIKNKQQKINLQQHRPVQQDESQTFVKAIVQPTPTTSSRAYATEQASTCDIEIKHINGSVMAIKNIRESATIQCLNTFIGGT